jgi:hypothetical protein
MARLPNGDRAHVDMDKLLHYCLDESRGRGKARVFKAALNLTSADASALRDALLRAAGHEQALQGTVDRNGTRYRVDFAMEHSSRRAMIRSGWIIRADEDFPRLVTCFVL